MDYDDNAYKFHAHWCQRIGDTSSPPDKKTGLNETIPAAGVRSTATLHIHGYSARGSPVQRDVFRTPRTVLSGGEVSAARSVGVTLALCRYD